MKRFVEDFRSAFLFPLQYVSAAGAAGLMTLVSTPAEASGGATQGTDIIRNITNLFSSAGNMLQVIAFTVGIGAALWGAYAATIGRRKRQAQEESIMVPMMAIVGGVVMATLIYTMGSVSETLYGVNAVDTSTLNSGF